jgi:hypothetical protein
MTAGQFKQLVDEVADVQSAWDQMFGGIAEGGTY